MAATNYTPIQLYRTTTAAATPSAGNLAAGELAINLTDEKLYFKNAAGVVKLLASSGGAVGTVSSVDVSGGTTGLTTSGGPITTSGTITLAGTLGVANGGTGATSLTSGYLVKGNGTSAASASVVYDDGTNVGIGTTGPGTAVDVYRNTAATASYRIQNANTAYDSNFVASDGSGSAGFGYAGSTYGGYQGITAAGSYWYATGAGGISLTTWNASAAIKFFTNSGSERMRIDSSGNLLVGTTSASGKFTVDNTGASTPVIYGKSGDQSGARIAISNSGTGGQTWQFVAGDVGVSNSGLSFYDATAAATRMRIDSSGNVGIGASPSGDRLNVAGTGQFTAASYCFAGVTSGSVQGQIAANGGGATVDIRAVSNHPVTFFTNNTERARIDSSGNVGIGTASPGSSTKLNVAGRGLFTGGSYDPGDGTASGVSISYDTGSNVGIIGAVQTGVTEREMRMRGNTLTFFTNGSNERMRIDSSGNVGIGTTSPGTRLQVRDAAAPSGFSSTSVRVTRDNYGADFSGYIDQGVGHGAIISTVDNGTPTERMRITGGGNVGIGTSSPGQKLTVAGTVESTSGGFKFPDGTTQTTAAAPGLSQAKATGLNFIFGL